MTRLLVLRPLPQTRGDCIDGPRPCPWVRCRYHLATKILYGARRLHVRLLPRGQDTCALDIADRGGHTLEEVGQAMGLTRERVRQIEAQALLRLRARLEHIAAAEGAAAVELFLPDAPPPGNWAAFDDEEGHGG